MGKPNVFNMPSGVPFLPSLAKGLREIYGERLNDALILLPTRRAVRALGEAFVGETGVSLLPRMRPLADINPEEPPFEPGELAGLVTEQIDPMQRRFEIAKIIAYYHARTSELPLDPAGALALADPLIAILDDGAMEEADLSGIADLKDIKDFAAAHFQNAIVLYEIIQTYWPKRLNEIGRMEPFARRVALLNALTALWSEIPPKYPVIIAGSTGTLAASARLMSCVSRFKGGMIILPGLNNSLPNTAWANVGAQHPQNSLKQLIKTIGMEAGDIPNWPHTVGPPPSQLTARRDIISESLVPVEATGDWPARIQQIRDRAPSGSAPFAQALTGLSIIEAATNDEEAMTIALIMRKALNTPGRTAALVTPDPALARRVKARLRRWSVDVDYSQGEPLEETSLGTFLSLAAALTIDAESQINLAELCKHPLTALAQTAGDIRRNWEGYERLQLRGSRREKERPVDPALMNSVRSALKPLTDIDRASARQWAKALSETAETLAQTYEKTGAEQLWVDDAGEKAASLLEGLMTHGDYLGDMNAAEFARLLASLMRGRVVRPRYGTHPRLSILGPLEARMLNVDQIILGGLNEGIWPAAPSIEPFLSRGMRQTLKLSLPERRFGLSAHDFAELASNPEVILTRAKRSDDGPMVASRWLWRLKTLMKGALEGEADTALSKSNDYLDWARQIDHVSADDVKVASAPRPTPPKEARWPGENGRKLSITQIKTWIRDPYSIYAKKILRLYPLDDLDMPIGVREYGNAIHNGLETFVKAYPKDLPSNAEAKLIEAMQNQMLEAGFEDFHVARDQTRLEKVSAKVIAWMRERRATGWAVSAIEERGELLLKDVNFTLTGKPDLVEKKGGEGFAVNDYKTGAPATVKVVTAGFDPQLPLTAYMLANGGFVSSGETAELNYIRIKGSGDEALIRTITPPAKGAMEAMDYAADAIDTLRKLITAFDDPETAYYSQPRIQYMHDYGDYDHLARRDEWARLGSEGGN